MARNRGAAKPEVPAAPAAKKTPAIIPFDWAVNTIKLNRAIAHVRQQKVVKESDKKEFEAAVQARYIELGGLLKQDAPVLAGKKGRGAKGANVVNMADNDEADEDEDEEEEVEEDEETE